MSALTARIDASYGTGFRLDVEIAAASGTTLAIMGPSGAGKSTLLSVLAGLTALNDGRIALDDDVLGLPGRQVAPDRRGTVLLGQDPRLFPHLSARENVAFGPRAGGVSKSEAARTAVDWLARVGLPDAGDRRPAELSGGQQQRVAIARALAASPRLVLLDEPLTSLDPVTADGIRTVLAEHLAGRTCVFVTHDAVDAVALAHNVAVIEAGRVSQAGSVRDVLREPATDFVASLAGLNRVVGVARNRQCVVDGVAIVGAGAPTDGAEVAAVFRPSDVRLVTNEASDAATRWHATVRRFEQTLGGVRVHTEGPAVAVDVPLDELSGMRVGDEISLELTADAVRLVPVG